MKVLTRAEEQIMQILWRLKKGFVKDIMAELPEPKPAYNTVSTIVRILERKEFVSYKAYGKTHEYYPLISKDDYKKQYLNRFVKNYFGDSFPELVSFFARDRNLSISELEDLANSIKRELNHHKSGNDE
jgi:predicted transcriptional regulator